MKVTNNELFNILLLRNDYPLCYCWDMMKFAKEMGYKHFGEMRNLETMMNLEVYTDWQRERRNEVLLGLLKGECQRAKKITFIPTSDGWKVDIEK